MKWRQGPSGLTAVFSIRNLPNQAALSTGLGQAAQTESCEIIDVIIASLVPK
jgi:hypothetical protein